MGQLQSMATLELIGLFLKGFYRELVHVVSVPISWAKARHMVTLISMEAGTNDLIMCLNRGESKVQVSTKSENVGEYVMNSLLVL